jgi:hypothetical protein
MDFPLIVAANLVLAIIIASAVSKYLSARKAKRQKRQVSYMREEIDIDSHKVPEFKPTWDRLN